jgi:hypothetical protein
VAVCGARATRHYAGNRISRSEVIADSFSEQIRGFHRGLKDIGFVADQNFAIEYAWSDDQFDRLPALAAELVRRRVDVIVASGGSRVCAGNVYGLQILRLVIHLFLPFVGIFEHGSSQ